MTEQILELSASKLNLSQMMFSNKRTKLLIKVVYCKNSVGANHKKKMKI